MTEERRTNGHGRRSTDHRDRDSTRELIIAALSSWRFWMVLWGFILVFAISLSLVTYSRESSDRAARNARAQASYTQCLAGIPFTKKINRFIEGVRTVGDVLLGNSVRMHDVSQPGTPLYRAQAKNIRKLTKALNDQRAVTSFPVPTAAECRANLARGVG